MNPDSPWTAIIRHILTTLGGILVSKGWLEAGTLEILVGAVAALIGVAWSIWNKQRTKVAIDTALEMPAGKTRSDLEREVEKKD